MDEYYLKLEDQTQGPYRLEEVRRLWHEARLNLQAQYWDAGTESWQPVERLLFAERYGEHAPRDEQRRNRRYRLELKRTWTVLYVAMTGFVLSVGIVFELLKVPVRRVDPELFTHHLLLALALFFISLALYRMYLWSLFLIAALAGYLISLWVFTGSTRDLIFGCIVVVALGLAATAYRRMRWK
ncbi:MAG: GYF domain-containing protein [Verrucomicrobiota bacterium]